MLTQKSFDTGEVTLNYVEGPDNGPPFVLIHGVTSRWQTFEPILPRLSQRWHVYACDLRGHGLSGRTPGAYAFTDFVRDVVRWLQADVARPLILYGHSLGGLVALGAAARCQDLVRGLILSDIPLVERDDERFRQSDQAPYFAQLYELLRPTPSLAEILTTLQGTKPEISAGKRDRAEELFHVDPEVLLSIIERTAPRGFAFADYLSRITCPTLLLQADPAKGQVLNGQDLAFAQEHLRDSSVVLIPDAGHRVHMDQPAASLDAVNAFIVDKNLFRSIK